MPKPVLRNKHNNNSLLGIGCMLVNALALSVIYLLVRELTKELASSLVVFIYKAMILIAIIPWCFNKGLRTMKTDRLWLHIMRGFASVSGTLCTFYAIKYIPLGDITAVGYMEQVLWVIIGIVLFGESMVPRKIISIVLSFVGAVLVVYPSLFGIFYDSAAEIYSPEFGRFNKYYFFVFLSIIFWAANCALIKILGKTEATKIQLFYNLIFQLIFALPFAFLTWQDSTFLGITIREPTGFIDFNGTDIQFSHMLMLMMIAFCYFAHSISFFTALRKAEVSIVAPFDYCRILFGALLGYIFFNEIIAKEKIIGYSLITGSGIYLVCAEARHKKRLKALQIQQLEEELEHA